MKSSISFRFSSLVLFFFIVAASIAVDSAVGDCTYWLSVKTGIVPGAGTHSRISLVLGSSKMQSFLVPDLEKWGDMPSGYVYFQNGKLDRFKGEGPCVSTPVCHIAVASDGSGKDPGWYLEYVAVSSDTVPKPIFQRETLFRFYQWLEPPNKLTQSRDHCKSLSAI